MNTVDLTRHGITIENILWNPSPATLYHEAIKHDPAIAISSTGSLIAYSGEKTGRSPKDKRVVKSPASENDVWWGTSNIPVEEESFLLNRKQALDYLNTLDKLYCIDGFAGWDTDHRLKVRTICARPYHALFMHNMLISPEPKELSSYGTPDCVIFNAGTFSTNCPTPKITPRTRIDLNLESREIVILGTQYAGEMKKAVFSLMHYLMPKSSVLSMHCSATENKKTHESSILFGLSGTGKTTLSADPKRLLVGDDEHCWTDSGIFNIEGGCYAKTMNLTREAEPKIFGAIKFGTVLENVIYNDFDHSVDFSNTSITENTRASYPIDFIDNAKIPCITSHPSHVIFLTCDAFGVLPPVSKLTLPQAEYHFISGYTAKVAGTEVGVTEPKATFSPCFSGPFLIWHPGKYADLLAARILKHKASVWLVNTGWTGGPYDIGSRINLTYTRAIIDAIHAGELTQARTSRDRVFGLNAVTECPGVPIDLLLQRNTWKNKDKFDESALKLASLFVENFSQYADNVEETVLMAGPTLQD